MFNLIQDNDIIFVFISLDIAMIFIGIFLYCYIPQKSALHQIYDQCDRFNGKWQYMIKIIFGEDKYGYDCSSATVSFELFNPAYRYQTRISIPPKVFIHKSRPIHRDQDQDVYRILTFQFNRKYRLDEIGYVRLSHDYFGGEILIYSFEIQNLYSGDDYKAKIDQFIEMLAPHMPLQTQLYRLNDAGKQPIRSDDVLPSEIINPLEWCIFLSAAVNLFPLFATKVIPCTINILCSYYQDLWTSVNAALTASFLIPLIILVFILVYKLIIKRKYSLSNGTSNWYLIRVLFMIVLALGSISLGLGFCYQAAKELDVKQQHFWKYTLIISMVPFVIISLILLIGAFYAKILDEIHNENIPAYMELPIFESFSDIANSTDRTMKDERKGQMKDEGKKDEKTKSR